MYNKIILAGHLSKDIEIRYTQSGSAIANTAIASTRKFKGADGMQKEEVLFVDVTFFGRSAEIANQYLRKGSKVLLDGRLKLDQWTDKQGQKRSKHSVSIENITMLDTKSNGQSVVPTQDKHHVSPEAQAKYYEEHPSNASQQQPNMTEPPVGGGEYIDGGGIRQNTPMPDMDETDEIPF